MIAGVNLRCADSVLCAHDGKGARARAVDFEYVLSKYSGSFSTMQHALNQACGYLARIQCGAIMQASRFTHDTTRASFDEYHSVLGLVPVAWIIYHEMRATALKYTANYVRSLKHNVTWEFERAIQYGDDVFLLEITKESLYCLVYDFARAETIFLDERAFHHFIGLMLTSCSSSTPRGEHMIRDIAQFLKHSVSAPVMATWRNSDARQSYLSGTFVAHHANPAESIELMFHFDLDVLKVMMRDSSIPVSAWDKMVRAQYSRPVIASPKQIRDLALLALELPLDRVGSIWNRVKWIQFVAEWYIGQPNWSPECLREIERVAVVTLARRILIRANFPSMGHVRAFARYNNSLVIGESESLIALLVRENSEESLTLLAQVSNMSAGRLCRCIWIACHDLHMGGMCQGCRDAILKDVLPRVDIESYIFAVYLAIQFNDPEFMQLALDIVGVTERDVQWCASLCFRDHRYRMLDVAVRALTDRYHVRPMLDDCCLSRHGDSAKVHQEVTVTLCVVLIVARYYVGEDWGDWVCGGNHLIDIGKNEAEDETSICEIARLHPMNLDILARVLSDPLVVPDAGMRKAGARCIEKARASIFAGVFA
jgi:hypothetical protein